MQRKAANFIGKGVHFMKRGIILYRSKYGAAKRYANWLAQATGFDCVEIGKADIDAVRQVPAVILCGGIYAGGIGGIGWIQAHWQALQGCKLAVFAVGASPWDADALRELRARNLKPPMEKIPCFYGRGVWDESVMGFRDRVLVKLLKKMTAKQDPAGYEPWQAALMSGGSGPADWTDRAYLRRLLDATENGWQSPE